MFIPWTQTAPNKSTSLLKKAQVENRSILSASQRAPALLATNEERRTTTRRTTGTPAVPHVTRNAVPVTSQGTTRALVGKQLNVPRGRIRYSISLHSEDTAIHFYSSTVFTPGGSCYIRYKTSVILWSNDSYALLLCAPFHVIHNCSLPVARAAVDKRFSQTGTHSARIYGTLR